MTLVHWRHNRLYNPTQLEEPNIDQYDETINLNEHIDVYVTQMIHYTTKDLVLCYMFPTSLKGGG